MGQEGAQAAQNFESFVAGGSCPVLCRMASSTTQVNIPSKTDQPESTGHIDAGKDPMYDHEQTKETNTKQKPSQISITTKDTKQK